MEIKQILNILEDVVYHPDRILKKNLDAGRKIIGSFHSYVPEALVYAAGMMPFGMWGGDVEAKLVRKYFPPYTCGVILTTFEKAMRGDYSGMSAVMIPMLCDSLKCTAQNWIYAVPDIEMIPVIYPKNRNSKGADKLLRNQYAGIKARLEEISGQKITNEMLREAIINQNIHNKVMREFVEVAGKYPTEILSQTREVVFRSSCFMDILEHTKLVKQLTMQVGQESPKRFNGVRVITIGMTADYSAILEIFEHNKIAVIMDEVASESKRFQFDIPLKEDPLDGLVQQYMDLCGCSFVADTESSRENQILELIKKYNVDGVIVLMTKFCDPEEYDYPIIKDMLKEQQIPCLMIEVDKQTQNYGQVATAVQSFQEMIRL